MKKRILSLLMAAVLLFCLLPAPVSAAGEGVTLKLHYHRPDGVYDNWTVWFWIDQGAAYPFVEEDGEMVATYTFQPGATKIGYIVRLGEWTRKDVNADQFIDVSGILAGTLHVYVESGVPGHTVVQGDDVQSGVVVTSARYDGDTTVTVQTSSALSADKNTFSIPGSAVSELVSGGTSFRLILAEPLDMLSRYTVTFNDKEYVIEMPDYFSTPRFEEQFTYEGGDLGMTYSPEKTVLRVWAPTANGVTVNLYTDGDPAAQPAPVEQVPMTAGEKGTWVCELSGDRNGTYYTYLADVDGKQAEACDPYARATGVNGRRAMILDLRATDPAGWDKDADPNAGKSITDAVIYELHVRDLSSDPSSGISNVGKYLGLIETGTKNAAGQATGLDHIKELGVTHLHILPAYDYGSVDESRLNEPQFNWGYDPVNYNVPEGSYSTDPYHGDVRVREFKEMVKGLHDNGISVVLDVVYNHVQDSNSFCFNQLVPGYFSRPNSNGSGCGNDTASERAMVSRYIVDSVKYWADEYHIDGFRFDLVGLIDTDTINAIVTEVHADHPDVIFYGEGWSMSTNVTKFGTSMATQTNSSKVPGFAFFSDTIRDMLKGSVFDHGPGYVSGASGKESLLTQCFMARPSWTKDPTQIINYVSCHDNNTLIDRITLSNPYDSREAQVKMSMLAAAVYMTAQGVPFMQAGEEMLRSKPLAGGGFSENSYNLPDSVNSIKWDELANAENDTVFQYYKGLIAFRKAHPSLRLTTEAAVTAAVKPVDGLEKNVTAFHISDVDGDQPLFLIFNPNKEAALVTLPEGVWTINARGDKAGLDDLGRVSGRVEVPALSAMFLLYTPGATVTEQQPEQTASASPAPAATAQPAGPGQSGGMNPAPVIIGCVVLIALAAALLLLKKKNSPPPSEH